MGLLLFVTANHCYTIRHETPDGNNVEFLFSCVLVVLRLSVLLLHGVICFTINLGGEMIMLCIVMVSGYWLKILGLDLRR